LKSSCTVLPHVRAHKKIWILRKLKGDWDQLKTEKWTGRGNPRAAALARGEINQLGFDYTTEQQKTQQKITEQRISDEQARKTGKLGYETRERGAGPVTPGRERENKDLGAQKMNH
jgi:hypothetical protein